MHAPSGATPPSQTSSPRPVVILTGLSGAGKSTAINVFEDLGFFAVDGLPAPLMPKMAELFRGEGGEAASAYRGLVLGMDLRQRDFSKSFNIAYESLAATGDAPQIVFIEAKKDVLVRRYAETRRPHPLQGGEEGRGLEQAIDAERELLEPLRRLADLVVDTSTYSVHDLRRTLQEKWSSVATAGSSLRVHLITFGFKYGAPAEADMVFDLRFLPNPYFEPELRPYSGKDKAVADYVLAADPGKTFLAKLADFLTYLLPLYEAEGRYRVTIAIGCTGGRHRSVATAEAVHAALTNSQYSVSLEHRHLELG